MPAGEPAAWRRFWLYPLTLPGMVVLLGGCGPGPSVGPAPQVKPGPTCSLTVSISEWHQIALGSVAARSASADYEFSGGPHTVQLSCPTRIRLTESPADPLHAPFIGWRIGGRPLDRAFAIVLEVSGQDRVTASFRIPPAASPGPT